ncbi:Restriction endonuclease type IV, Mrr [Burkholderiaceae bacterium]
MKFKMAEKSLFAALLRSPWWVSFLVMLAVALVAGALLPDPYKVVGMVSGFPFLVIGVIAAWQQRNALSPERLQALTEQARNLGWTDFSSLIEKGFSRQGFVVRRLHNSAADLQLEKNGRITWVSAKRWKAATVGAEQLRDLVQTHESQATGSCALISLGQFSQAAITLAHQNHVELMGPQHIAQLMHDGLSAQGH